MAQNQTLQAHLHQELFSDQLVTSILRIHFGGIIVHCQINQRLFLPADYKPISSMEDESDWSDGPINSPSLRAVDTHGFSMGFDLPELSFNALPHSSEPRLPHRDYKYPKAYQEFVELPVGDPFNPYINGSSHLKSAVSPFKRAKIGVYTNRRKPSREDYSNFVLYQASQRVYEATFLKNFVAHALHPNRFDACFSAQDPQESVGQYLKSVADNVNKLATKIIWNTHSRTVNFMANDEKETTVFWDFQQFENQSFANFSPGNTFPVLRLMNQSWHRAFSHPSMVRYSAEQYQIGPDASPFEEIDEVTGHTKLFEGESIAHTASHDRVVRAPRMKKPKISPLPGATLRGNPTTPNDDWLQGLLRYGSPSSFRFSEDTEVPITVYSTSQDMLPLEAIPASDACASGAKSVWGGASGGIVGSCPIHENSMHMNDDAEASTIRITRTPAEEPTCPESLVALLGSDALWKDSGQSSSSEDTTSEDSRKRTLWRMVLIQDHKNRLAERWPQSQQRLDAALDFNSCVERAIKNGDLKPLRAGLRKLASFVDPPAVVLPANRVQSGSNKISILQTVRAIQQDGDNKGSAVDSGHSTRRNSQLSVRRPNKRQKRAPKARISKSSKSTDASNSSKTPEKPEATLRSAGASSSPSSIPAQANPDNSTSKTLEDHQQLPPDAYFEKMADDEQPAWRCGIKHPMAITTTLVTGRTARVALPLRMQSLTQSEK
ncbi:hypothetical protein DPSP01_013526 [Paraphaeosphaeria sporulosa]